jgi:DNA-binding transcriptional ArsR family regulator
VVSQSEVHAESRKDGPLEAEAADAIAETMQAISAPSRVRLLYALRGGALSVGELAEATGLAQPAASQQLRILRHLRLVVGERVGQTVRYRLHDHHVATLLDEIRNHVEHAIEASDID